MKILKTKFNGIIYPYVNITVYDYEINSDKNVSVSTEDLQKALANAMFSDNPEIVKKAQDFNPDIKYFITREMLYHSSPKDIAAYITATS